MGDDIYIYIYIFIYIIFVAKEIIIVDDLPAGHFGQVQSQFHQSLIDQ